MREPIGMFPLKFPLFFLCFSIEIWIRRLSGFHFTGVSTSWWLLQAPRETETWRRCSISTGNQQGLGLDIDKSAGKRGRNISQHFSWRTQTTSLENLGLCFFFCKKNQLCSGLAGEISYMNGFLTALGILVIVLGIALALKLYQRQKKDRDWEPPRRSTRSPEAGTVLGQRSSDTEPDRVTPVAPVAAAPARARKAAVSVERRSKMTRAQMKSAKAMAAFRKLDKDSSGFISRVELQAVLVHLPQRTADAVFQALDTDGDGRISFKEFEERFYPMIDDEDESLAEGIDFDGAWLMEWPDGDHVVCHVSGNRFSVFHKVFQLRPDLEPPRLQWQDGTVQELEHCGEGRLQWKLSKRWSVQYLHWVRIPYCPVNHAHKMKLAKGKQDYVCTRCHLSRSNEWFWFCPLCSEYESALCPECAAVPPEPEKMVYGIRASYVLNNFPDIARFYTDLPNPDFYQMADVIAKGERGIGYQKICPRDGQPGCSIVDAVDERHRGKVTHFVSWCWQYKLNDFVSAISSWVQREGLDPLDVCLWVSWFFVLQHFHIFSIPPFQSVLKVVCNQSCDSQISTSWLFLNVLYQTISNMSIDNPRLNSSDILQPTYGTKAHPIK